MNFTNSEKKYNTSEHLIYSCQYHVIFCPKYRRNILNDKIAERLKEMVLFIADKYNFSVPDIEVMPDHVHMIIDCNPRFGVCECIKKIKWYTAHHLREEFPELKRKLPCMWTRSCFISSVGSVSLETVKQYIENQKNK